MLGYNRGRIAHHHRHRGMPDPAAGNRSGVADCARAGGADRGHAATPSTSTVTQTESGLDIAATGAAALRSRPACRWRLRDPRQDFARLSMDGEIVIEPKKPRIMFGAVPVIIPPGGFLQAVAAAEQAMAELVLAHLTRAKKVADLFSGSGAFALRLARTAEVHAVEGDQAALAAFDRGFRSDAGLKRVTVEKPRPVPPPADLQGARTPSTALVFDPPRAGAEDQSKQIARSDVPLVAAISCNPATLARDLRILIDGGYTLTSVTPIDQFLWSPHVEAVALAGEVQRGGDEGTRLYTRVPPSVIWFIRRCGWPTPTGTPWPALPHMPMPVSSFMSLPTMVTRCIASGPLPISIAPLIGWVTLPSSIM